MRAAAVALAAALAACAELPEVTRGVCGNGVVELDRGEECDGTEGCGAPEAAHACLLVCATAADCPEGGHACGADGRCRLPTGTFTPGGVQEAASVAVTTTDLDGDGAADLLGYDSGGMLVRYGDWDAAMAAHGRTPLPFTTAAACTPDVNGDGARDLVSPVADFGFGLFLNDGARALVPVAQSALDLDFGGDCVRIDSAGIDGDRDPATAAELLLVVGGETVSFLDDDGCAASPADCTVSLHDEPGGDLVEPGVVAAALGYTGGVDPGEQFTFGVVGHTWISVWGELAGATLRPERVGEWQLPEPLAADGFVALANVDADGCPELIVDTGTSLQVAHSTSIDVFGTTVCTGLAASLTPAARPAGGRIVAAGDLTGDGIAELLYVARTDPAEATPVRWLGAWLRNPLSGAWYGGPFLQTVEQPRSAAVLDYNRDGWNDVVVAMHGPSILDFFLSYEGQGFNRFTADVGGEPRVPAVGDFDGDLHDDVVVAVVDPADPTGDDRLVIVYGDAGGRPGPVQSLGEFVAEARPSPLPGGISAHTASVVVMSNRLDGAAECDRRMSILLGDTSRQLVSPYVHLFDTGATGLAPLVPVGVVDVSTADTARVLALGLLPIAEEPPLAAVVMEFDGTAFAPTALQTQAPADVLPPFYFFYATWRVGDLDGDGSPEVVVLALDRGAVIETATSLEPTPIDVPPDLHGVPWFDLVDLDADGDLDAVGARPEEQGAPTAGLWVAWNDGGALDFPGLDRVDLPVDLYCVDADVIVAAPGAPPGVVARCHPATDEGGATVLAFGRIDPDAPEALVDVAVLPVEGTPDGIEVADFTGDGLDDVAVLGTGTVRMLRQCRAGEVGCAAPESLP